MRHGKAAYLLVLLLSGAVVAAQDAKNTTATSVKSDNGKVITMTGCVQIGGATSFVLTNISSEHEHDNKPTSRGGDSYALIEREGLDLGPYIHQTVELTGVVVPAATGTTKSKLRRLRKSKCRTDRTRRLRRQRQ